MTTRNLRMATALVLFAFILGHLINLAFGLISVNTMDAARKIILAPWSNWIGLGALAISVMVHAALGLHALYQRNTLRLNSFDTLQLGLGLAIPWLLLPHMIAMIGGPLSTGLHLSYAEILKVYWILDPMLGLRQVLALMAVWIHACMGLYLWFRLMAWWPRFGGLVNVAMVIIPVLALLGFIDAGREIIEISDTINVRFEAFTPAIMTMSRAAPQWYVLLLALVFVARWVRTAKRPDPVSLKYVTGPTVETQPGLTILETSRANDVSHASLCSGKGRCGTCQVLVRSGEEFLVPPDDNERATLAKFGCSDGTRLACQAKLVGGPIVIERRYTAGVQASDAPGRTRRHGSSPAPAGAKS